MDVVLVNPLIPQNTGSIARTCAATETPLHLVGQLGFEISEKRVRRAGLDYWPHVKLSQHHDWDAYITARQPKQVWILTKFAERPYYDANFGPNDALVFGSETVGIPAEIKARYPDSALRIPISCDAVRSLNLSNAVAIVLYEALRQQAVSSKQIAACG